VDSVEPVEETRSEIARVFELDRRLAARVHTAIAEDAFPLVLAGAYNRCLGTVADASAGGIGVVWFDTHADFDTPDDNLSGFLDVMGLAILTGSGWRALRETIPGFVPVHEEKVVLAGVRDLEPYQRARLERSHIRTVPGSHWREEDFEAALDELRGQRRGLRGATSVLSPP
jgi:arginase